MRKNGHYWIKLEGQNNWTIALWDGEVWWLIGGDQSADLEDVTEIDEKMITR